MSLNEAKRAYREGRKVPGEVAFMNAIGAFKRNPDV